MQFLAVVFIINIGFWKNISTIEAFLSGVPDDKMIILDLNSEQSPLWQKTKFYFGKPFIWCLLHNYGGIRGVYGPMNVIAADPVDAMFTVGTTMAGTGMTPEAIEHNPVVYDLMVSEPFCIFACPVNVSHFCCYNILNHDKKTAL